MGCLFCRDDTDHVCSIIAIASSPAFDENLKIDLECPPLLINEDEFISNEIPSMASHPLKGIGIVASFSPCGIVSIGAWEIECIVIVLCCENVGLDLLARFVFPFQCGIYVIM